MFRALLWKEWRQLGLVRWGGVALGAVLPVAFTIGAEMGERGLLPTGSVTSYAPRDLMYEVLPAALAFGLWPLIGLISVVQALTGDRASGTEAFLLERPIPRGTTWRARLAASLLTLLLVIGATAAIAAAAAALTGAPPAVGWSRWVGFTTAGVVISVLAYLGGVAAGSLVASPLGALLLGVILGGLPVLIAAQLSIVFAYARFGGVFLGVIVPLILLPAFIVASWLAFCRGEPAGRGRVQRALSSLGAALAGALILFVVLAPVVIRADARAGQHAVQGSASGTIAFVAPTPARTGWGGGWLADLKTGERLTFIPPPVSEVAWGPDGSQLAVVTWSAPFGASRGRQRIEIRSAADGTVVRTIPFDDQSTTRALAWADQGIVAVVLRQPTPSTVETEIEIIDPKSGARRRTGFHGVGWSMGLFGPADDGRVFARTTSFEQASENRTLPRGFHLFPVDVAAARVGPALSEGSGVPITFAGWPVGLSRSGRLARVIDPGAPLGDDRVIDLDPGAGPVPRFHAPGARWIAGDRLVWVDALGDRKRMFVWAPGGLPTAVREWSVGSVGIEPSPDGRAVFVSVIEGQAGLVEATRRLPDPALFEGDAPKGRVPEEAVYLPEEDRFVSLGAPFSDRANDQRYTQWAGSKTLARIALGAVCFEDIAAPGVRRCAIGGPR